MYSLRPHRVRNQMEVNMWKPPFTGHLSVFGRGNFQPEGQQRVAGRETALAEWWRNETSTLPLPLHVRSRPVRQLTRFNTRQTLTNQYPLYICFKHSPHTRHKELVFKDVLTEYLETHDVLKNAPLLLMPGFDSKPDHVPATENI